MSLYHMEFNKYILNTIVLYYIAYTKLLAVLYFMIVDNTYSIINNHLNVEVVQSSI